LKQPRKYGWWFWAKLVIGLALLAWAGYKLYELYNEWRANPQEVAFVPSAFVLSIAVYLVALLVTFFRWYVLVRAVDLPFKIGDSIRLGFVGFVSSLLAPGSVTGDLVKMGFIATEQKRRAAAVSTIIADRIVGLYALFLLSSILGVFYWEQAWQNDWLRGMLLMIWCVTGGGGAVALFLFLVDVPFDRLISRLGRFARLARILSELTDTLQLYRSRAKAVCWSILLSMIGHAGFVLSFYLCALSLQGSVPTPSWQMHFLIIPVGMVFQAVPISFGGNVGVNETFFDFLYKLADPNYKYGVLISLLQRGVTWIVGLIGLVWYLPLRQAMKKTQAQAVPPVEMTIEPAAAPPAASQEPSHEAVP
jgi:hypothetical protein